MQFYQLKKVVFDTEPADWDYLTSAIPATVCNHLLHNHQQSVCSTAWWCWFSLLRKKKSCKYQSYHQSICLIMWWWANRIILVSLRSSRREMKCTFYYFDVWCWWVPSCAWAVRNVAYSMIAAMTLTWWARMSVIRADTVATFPLDEIYRLCYHFWKNIYWYP